MVIDYDWITYWGTNWMILYVNNHWYTRYPKCSKYLNTISLYINWQILIAREIKNLAGYLFLITTNGTEKRRASDVLTPSLSLRRRFILVANHNYIIKSYRTWIDYSCEHCIIISKTVLVKLNLYDVSWKVKTIWDNFIFLSIKIIFIGFILCSIRRISIAQSTN